MPGIETLARVRAAALDEVAGQPVDVWLFGSWVGGTPTRTSDIDIAVDPHGPVPSGLVARLRERMEELAVAYPVEVVDLRDAGRDFRELVRREGIRWTV